MTRCPWRSCHPFLFSVQSFTWHLFGTIRNKPLEANGHGFGRGYRQHQWGSGGKGFGEHGYPNLAYALAWEGHAGRFKLERLKRSCLNDSRGGTIQILLHRVKSPSNRSALFHPFPEGCHKSFHLRPS